MSEDLEHASPKKQLGVAESDGLVDIDDENSYSFYYYQTQFLKVRAELVKEVFKQITSDWQHNYVVYPLSSSEDIKIMISRYYFILFEVDSPITNRYKRFSKKYAQ